MTALEELTPEDVVHQEMNRLRGKLAGFVEACSLPEKQERAIIRTLKSISYDAEKQIIEAIEE